MIESSFESTYCREGVSVLSRGPMHYDLRRCGGQCRPTRAPRTMYRMVVNATTYSVDAVEDEDEEDPEMLRATCDSLLEGQVIFQARPSDERTSVKVIWNPRRTNYGSIIFRAWIVQSIESIFVVDSPPLTNPLNGENYMEIETHFRNLLSAIAPTPKQSTLNRQQAVTTGRRQIPRMQHRRIPPDRFNRNLNQDSIQQNASVESRRRPSQEEEFNSETLTMEQFEEAFLARMNSGFDLSEPDPFLDFEREVLMISDLIPDEPGVPTSLGTNLDPLTGTDNNSLSISGEDFGPFSQRFPGQMIIPQLPNELSPFQSGNTVNLNPGVLTQLHLSPFLTHQPNRMVSTGPTHNSVGFDPRSRFTPHQNPFDTSFNPPWASFRNSANPGSNPGFSGQTIPHPSQAAGRINSNNNFPNSNMLPGINHPFISQGIQPNINAWNGANNVGANQMMTGGLSNPSSFPQNPTTFNWGSQNGALQQLMPNWNLGPTQTGWSGNLPRTARNPFGSNMAPRPFQSNTIIGQNLPNMNLPFNPNNMMLRQFGNNGNSPPAGGSLSGPVQSQNPSRMNGNLRNSENTNSDQNSLGSFDELFHAAGGWGSQ
ncbi:hypothetical protein PoB_006877500 [Plakobranchus ocellatus]|uniref:Uncharacterized protein n=1 Tax=Plakobranchus ocellatus TaxID=259542 RepID=A0AAV4DE88_9GAST|nr:hypothetical protein PoB_006877500 [Plakobranchus ocellatus]